MKLPKIVKNKFVEPVLFNLEKVDIYNFYEEQLREGNDIYSAFCNNCSLEDYLKTNEYTTFYKNRVLVETEGNFFVIINNLIYFLTEDMDKIDDKIQHDFDSKVPSAIILPSKDNKGEVQLLLNADTDEIEEGDYPEMPLVGYIEGPTISFTCLNRFYPKLSCNKLYEAIVDGRIDILDFTPDQSISFTDSQREQFMKWDRSENKRDTEKPVFTPPKPGFTQVYGSFHRPATVLIKDTRVGGCTMLFGQDYDAYFGVELAGNPKTVKDAYIDLMPPEVRKAKGVMRQGEHFAIPVAEKDWPKVEDFIIKFDDVRKEEALFLNRDSEDSAKHYLSCTEGGIANNKVFVRNFSLVHENDDHPAMILQGRYMFARNTAKRAFSVKGVD